MNDENKSTIKKSIRIPKHIAEEIDKEAKEKKQSFSDIAIYKLQHFDCPLTPSIMGKVQDIVNLAMEAVMEYDTQKADFMKMEVMELWNYLK